MPEIHVTDAMRQAGERMADDCYDVGMLAVSNDSLEAYLAGNDIPNKDVVARYGRQEIVSVEAIYIAMERAKLV